MTFRPIVRRAVPHAMRWRLRAVLRLLSDRRNGVVFGEVRETPPDCIQRLCCYSLPVACYPGQEDRYAGKLQNLSLALAAIDGAVAKPGETLSFWRFVGRPTRTAGYTEAAALKSGRLTEEVGGSICLASTVLYNIGLLAAMRIAERYCHSVDSYGEARYFELGRDAAVEYAYRDLRMRNELPAPIVIRSGLRDGRAFAEAWSTSDVRLDVRLEVGPVRYLAPEQKRQRTLPAIEVQTRRTVSLNGRTWTEDLGTSHHDAPRA